MQTAMVDTLHRLVKLALDSGEAADPEEAAAIFLQYRVRIHLGTGWAESLAGQAAFVTSVNTAVRAFLGGVLVTGDVTPTLSLPLFQGQQAAEVVTRLGGVTVGDRSANDPTLVIGAWDDEVTPPFCIQLAYDGWRAGIIPIDVPNSLSGCTDNPLVGVAAAALGVNEAFLHVRRDLLIAGHREVGISLWNPAEVQDWKSPENRGPKIECLPASLWLVGLGHLGQAYAWVIGMLPYSKEYRPHLVLQDFDTASESNLSTCMFLTPQDIGKRKTRVIAEKLEAAGFRIDIVEQRFMEGHHIGIGEPATALFGVDNIAARRAIELAGFEMVVEAGLGSGYTDFRNIRIHTFPGPRKAIEIWSAADSIEKEKVLSPTYERLAEAMNDRCGVTQLASRAVATPFVGVLAASLVIAEVVRSLHGGDVHPVIDIQMKELRYRTVARPSIQNKVRIPFFIPSAL